MKTQSFQDGYTGFHGSINTVQRFKEKTATFESVVDVLKKNKASLQTEQIPANRDFLKGDCGTFWCLLEVNGNKHRTEYSVGSGHKVRGIYQQPWIGDVFYCVLSDGRCFEDYCSVDDFAAEMCEGMKITEILRMYDDCRKAYEFMRDSFGADYGALCAAFQDF